LSRLKPNAVVALELPADSAGGEPKNMRGLKIGEFNQPLDQVLVAANQNKDIVTIGIGDGGNEAGMGGLPGLPQKALDGSDFASTVASQIPVTAFASNNAGLAIGAKLLANAGLKDSLVKPEEYGAAIKAAMNAGAVDGVTRLDKPNAPSADNKTMSGVDGFSVEANERFLNMINFIALREAIPALYAEKIEEGPFLVGLFDSSHGGLIAANTMIEELQNKFHGKVRLLPILDHGNAPYGDKDRDTLIKLVVDGLDVADQSKYDSVVMACNTACLAFMANPKDTKGIDLSKLKMPVHDLIANTAPHVAKNGGEYPVVLSTRATAEDPTYENRIREAAKSEKKNLKEIIRIGCGEENEKGKDWATLINHLKHESKDPADQELVRTQINKYVDQIPKHATSINLCCTHYPAIINQIKARLEETGKGHIPIFNPISVQVDALIDQLKNTNVDRRDRIDDTSPIIVTTGTPDQVTPAAVQTLLGQAASVLYSQFGDQFKLDLIAPLIRKRSEKDANSPANGHKKSNSTDSVD
jgi:glutamate racemase